MEQPIVALFPEPGACGPTNNLVASGNHLLEKGIRTVFVIEESFEGELTARGFEERLMRMSPPPAAKPQPAALGFNGGQVPCSSAASSKCQISLA
jgi:hypothetical protein